MAPLKVIGAGYGRTGTLSLCEALEILGFPCHHMEKVLLDPTQVPQVFTEAYRSGQQPNWDKVFQSYEAAVDWPAAAFWEQLMEYYPEAKVILTVRDPERWYNSVQSTVYEWPVEDEYQLPIRMKETRHMSRALLRNGVLRNFADKNGMIEQFREHIARVQKAVPSHRLLIFEASDGWAPLCQFLGVDVPMDKPYPCVNSGVDFKRRIQWYQEETERQEKGV